MRATSVLLQRLKYYIIQINYQADTQSHPSWLSEEASVTVWQLISFKGVIKLVWVIIHPF